MMRLGLVCLFREEPIRFRMVTARTLRGLARPAQLERLSEIVEHNAGSLLAAVERVAQLGLGAFRITSTLLPRATHPEVGYELDELPGGSRIRERLEQVRTLALRHTVRLSFHPDQFVVLGSPNRRALDSSLAELELHGLMAQWVGADMINIHAGGVYGDREAALARLRRSVERLSEPVRVRLTLENDDRSYGLRDLLPVARDLQIPLTYDVHHHRCLPDGLSVAEATELAARTWESRRAPQHVHVSSPKHGWGARNPRPHADYVDLDDFPPEWLRLPLTVDVEAKAKELAVLRLKRQLEQGAPPLELAG